MPASRMRVDPATGLVSRSNSRTLQQLIKFNAYQSTAKRTWIPRLYCALKTNHSGIDFCSSGKCIIINRVSGIG